MRTRPPSELARMRAHFITQGWNPADLHAFRMEADGDTSSGDDSSSEDDADAAGGDGDLGDAGKRALDAERAKARKATADLKPWKTLADDLGLTPEQIRDAIAKSPKDDGEPVDVKKLEREAQQRADAKANARIVRAEVKALAADLFADPGDAPLYLDLAKYEVDDDGEVDAAAIKGDLAEVLRSKPHLAKGKKKPDPDPSQGSNGHGKKESTPGLGRLRDAYAASTTTK